MSKKLKLSPWHDGSVNPVHVGWYKVKGPDIVCDDGEVLAWRKWNGKKWQWNAFKHGFKTDISGLADALIKDCDKWIGVMK